MNLTISRTANLLKIGPGEGGLVALITSIMFAANFGGAIGSPGVEALFYSRFGVEFLPYMYIILGLVSPFTSMVMSGLLARIRATRLYLFMPLVMALLLAGARVVLVLDQTWLYAVLWLGMNIYWILQNLFSWGSAGLVTDTRQAKRLFPLFGVGGIVGLALGSLATRPLVDLVGTENLILFWSLGLLAVFLLEQRLMSVGRIQPEPFSGKPAASFRADLRQSYQTVRSSSLLRWMALAAVLFAILYYSIVFPFARAVASEFPDEDSIAAFLGTFQGLATAAAIAASLFFANRLYGRFGLMTTILVYPIIYLIGFSIAAVSASFAALTVFRFVQIFWSEGVSEGANQAMYNVVPPEKRESARTFIRGIANQLGVTLAGIVLLLGERVLPAQYLYLTGMVVAGVTIYFVWQARRSYGEALIAALRAGQSHIFFSEEEPFGGFKQDARAVATAVAGMNSPEVGVRRVAAEILGRLSTPEATDAIVNALDDDDAAVRAALLRALGTAKATSALLEVAALLQDPEPEVRLEAVKTIPMLTEYPRGVQAYLELMMEDEDTAVRCQAAAELLRIGSHDEANALLVQLATAKREAGQENAEKIKDRILALEALAEVGGADNYTIAAMGLEDPSPVIRRASARLVARIDPELCLFPLQIALGDEDEYVQRAAAEAMGKIGEPALEAALSALKNPDQEQGALLALRYLPSQRRAGEIRKYIEKQIDLASHYHTFWRKCRAFQSQFLPARGVITTQPLQQTARSADLLADSLQEQARQHGRRALWAMGIIDNRAGVFLAIENLSSPDTNQRANALETLESIGEPATVRAILPLWEPSALNDGAGNTQWLQEVVADTDSWIRACGALFASMFMISDLQASQALSSGNGMEQLQNTLKQLMELDPAPIVREAIELDGGSRMDTLQTLSTMEKVIFLRQVPLFASLPPKDLLQIAAVTGERAFSDGTIIAEQGEPGDVLYIIVSGQVIVTAIGGDDTQRELGRRQPGEYVGEMSIISDEVRMARLTALGDVRTLYINRREFKELLHQRPEASLAVIKTLSTRLRELSKPGPA